jgi:hypothetical protein
VLRYVCFRANNGHRPKFLVRSVNQDFVDLFAEQVSVSVSYRWEANSESHCPGLADDGSGGPGLRGDSMRALLSHVRCLFVGVVAVLVSSCAQFCPGPEPAYAAPPAAVPGYGTGPGVQQYALPAPAPQYDSPPGAYSYGAPPGAYPYGASPGTPPYGPPPTGQYMSPPGAS